MARRIKLSKFEKDVIRFIKKHPYVKQELGKGESVEVIEDSEGIDRVEVIIPTVNGEYEEVRIIFDYKP